MRGLCLEVPCAGRDHASSQGESELGHRGMIRLLPRTTQTPLLTRKTGLVTAKDNAAWARARESQVNERAGVRSQLLTTKSGLWGHFSH